MLIPVFTTAKTTRARFSGQKYAVAIGISQFGIPKTSPPPPKLASVDAEEFARQLETKAGFKHENIRLLTNQKATLEQVRVAFSDFTAKAQSNDLLVVCIATHGLHDPRPNRGDKVYLALHGTQIATLDATALPLSELEILMNRGIRTNQCFLIFDVGHELNEDWRLRAGRNLVNNRMLNLFGEKLGCSILVSGSSDEVSSERTLIGSTSSLFTHWLIAGLSGAADLNEDRVVTAKELFSFVSQKVKTETGGAQNPRFRIASNTEEMAFADKSN